MKRIIKEYQHLFYLITFGIILYVMLINFGFMLSLIFSVLSIFVPFIIGMCIAFVLNVVMNKVEHFFEKRLLRFPRLKRTLSLSLTLIIVFGSIVGMMFFVIPELGKTIVLFASKTPTYLTLLNNFVQSLMKQWHIDPSILPTISVDWSMIGELIASFLQSGGLTVFRMTTSIFSGVVNTLLGIVFAVYLLLQKEMFVSQTSRLMKAYLPAHIDNKLRYFFDLTSRTFASFITGQFFEAILLGTLCFIGMMILRIPYAMMISVLVGFTALIPIVGALIGTSIGILLILTVNPMQAVIFLAYITGLQWVDNNFIYPRVVGKSVSLPGVWVLLAITVGGSAFGILGMIVAVPTCSVMYTLIKLDVSKRLDQKGEEHEKDSISS